MKLAALAALVAAAAAVFATTSGSAPAKAGRRAECPSADRVTSLPRLEADAGLRADVNGDGKRDAVTIRFDKLAPTRCAFYLRVATVQRTYTLKLGNLIRFFGKSDWNVPVKWSDSTGSPAIDAIVDLGGHGNLVVLYDGQGAANRFFDVIGLSHGRLEATGLAFGLGGTVMAVQSASCKRGGPLREMSVGSAWSKKHPHRWSFIADTYRRTGLRFTHVAHTTTFGSVEQAWKAAKHAGFGAKALAGCTLARSADF